MKKESKACINVSLVCTNSDCDNEYYYDISSAKTRTHFYEVKKDVRRICMECGKDMEIKVTKTTHTATTEGV